MLNIDTRRRQAEDLARHQAARPDPWDRIPYDYPVGKIVEGKVLKVLDFGAFVELEKGIEGLIHVSEISDERVEDPQAVRQARAGRLKAEIIGVDTAERKIGLSIRGATRAEELAEAQGFSGGVPTATLGDVFRNKLAALTPRRPTTRRQGASPTRRSSASSGASHAESVGALARGLRSGADGVRGWLYLLYQAGPRTRALS